MRRLVPFHNRPLHALTGQDPAQTLGNQPSHQAAARPERGPERVILSLGRAGQCWDNALSESFFASLKGELIDPQAWPSRAMARPAIVKYIAWYNGTRLQATLGYKSPAEFEEGYKIKKVA
jgi:transposase InsO family protein